MDNYWIGAFDLKKLFGGVYEYKRGTVSVRLTELGAGKIRCTPVNAPQDKKTCSNAEEAMRWSIDYVHKKLAEKL